VPSIYYCGTRTDDSIAAVCAVVLHICFAVATIFIAGCLRRYHGALTAASVAARLTVSRAHLPPSPRMTFGGLRAAVCRWLTTRYGSCGSVWYSSPLLVGTLFYAVAGFIFYLPVAVRFTLVRFGSLTVVADVVGWFFILCVAGSTHRLRSAVTPLLPYVLPLFMLRWFAHSRLRYHHFTLRGYGVPTNTLVRGSVYSLLHLLSRSRHCSYWLRLPPSPFLPWTDATLSYTPCY